MVEQRELQLDPEDMQSDEDRFDDLEDGLEIGERFEKHDLDVIKSLQTDWGVVLAGPPAVESDPYNRVWIRDNSLIALGLIQAGEIETAAQIVDGLLGLMAKYQPKIKHIIQEGKPYALERDASLIHPVYDARGKELDIEWGWQQNDGIGNLLLAAGTLNMVEDYKDVVSDLVKYLEVVEYWQKDRGIWEEGKQTQINTILSCTAGLRAVSDYVEVGDSLIERGEKKVQEIEGHSDRRYYDLAHLNPFLWGEVMDPHVIEGIEYRLLREHGVIRYLGDKYMSGGKHHEAEWVLGLLMLGHAWLVCENKEKAQEYLQKADDLRTENGDIPEAYVYKNGKYIPGEHTPLAWAHSLALALRRKLKEEELQ